MRKWRPIFWRALAFYRAQRWLICCKRLSQTPLYLLSAPRLEYARRSAPPRWSVQRPLPYYCTVCVGAPCQRGGAERQSIFQSIFPRSKREDSMHNTASAKRHREITEKCSSMPDTCETETLLTRYLDSLTHERKLSAHTLRGYTYQLSQLLLLAGGRALDALTPADIRSGLIRARAQGLSPRSIAHRLSVWRSFYRWLALQQPLSCNPV